MNEEVIEILEPSIVYKFGKFMFVNLVGFAATMVAEKMFDVGVIALLNRRNGSNGQLEIKE
jgi:hypothetical protein